MGILTIEDIVEELVGDIFDETDEVILDYKELGENIYEVDGDMNIYDFFELVDYDDRDFESEYTTVGGWCTDMLEKFPEVGDTFEFANFTVTITEVEGMRVGKIKVEIQEMIDEERIEKVKSHFKKWDFLICKNCQLQIREKMVKFLYNERRRE